MVAQRRIGLMPDGRDDGDRAGGDRTDDDFLIEAPKVLNRPAPACDDDEVGSVHPLHGGEAVDGGSDLFGRARPLHQHRPDDDPRRATVSKPVEDVADDSASGRRHDTNGARKERQRLLPLGREQPFGGELGLELFKEREQRAFAGNLHRLNDDLIFGPAGIGGELTSGDDLNAVLRVERQPRCAPLPHDAVDHGVLVLEREIEMAGGRAFEARNLAPDADMGEALLDMALEKVGYFTDRQRACIVACAFPR